MKRLLLVCMLFSFSLSMIIGQVSPSEEAKARRELEKLGITDAEIQERLLDKGIDIGNIDPTDPTQVMEAERALEESVRELQEEKRKQAEEIERQQKSAEKKAEKTIENAETEAEGAVGEEIKEVAKQSADEIRDAVEDGATIEEAISEELVDANEDNLPAAQVWGQQIFRDKSIRLYRSAKEIKPPNSYVLGVGDVINVEIWGYSTESIELEINEDGYVKPYKMPRVYIKGLTYKKAKELLENRFGQYYRFRPQEFEVTLNFARTITVNIVGEVFNYGSFTIPAINTAFNALVAAGGPSNLGSVRNIKLMRVNEPPRNIDIYKFLLDPSAEEKLYLEENDYIHVPIAERLITIRGAIKRPSKYELIAGEELLELIEFAGGLKDNAYKSKIQVKRFVDDKEVIIDIDLKDLENNNLNFKLLPSDEVQVNTISKPYKNFVTVDGAVEINGKFEATKGMRISELIKKAVLSEEAVTEIAFIKRKNEDGTIRYIKVNLQEILDEPTAENNITLNPEDRLTVYSKERYADNHNFSISGSVRAPSEYEFDQSQQIKVSDAVFLAGGLRYDATDFAYLYRTTERGQQKETAYVRINIRKAVDDPTSNDNVFIQPNDQLVVFSRLAFIDKFYVEISGAVRSPGQYQYDETLTLQDVLTMSKGLKYEAASNKIDIYRLEIDNQKKTRSIAAILEIDEDFNILGGDENFKLEPFDQIVVRNAPEFELHRTIFIEGEIKYPGPYVLTNENETISSILKRSGGLTDEAFPEGTTLFRSKDDIGFIVTKLDDVISKKNSAYDFILKDGDRIEIPKRKDFVTIEGATRLVDLYPESIAKTNKVNVRFHKGKKANFYISEYAAGIGKNGRKKLVTVEHPNGEIKRTKNFILFKIYPKVRQGSIVRVGRIAEKEEFANETEKDKKDWGEILANTVGQATAVLSLILLVQTVN